MPACACACRLHRRLIPFLPTPLLPPQDNLLWERLSAREHLFFYARLKNLRGADLTAAVDAALQSVNLYHGGVGDKQVGGRAACVRGRAFRHAGT